MRWLRRFIRKQVDYVYPIIKSIPRTRLIYRPSVAGHVDCETYPAPVSRMEDLKPITFWGNWAWSLFEWYNEIWKDVMDQDNMTPSGLSGMLPVHFRTRLRPECAHRSSDVSVYTKSHSAAIIFYEVTACTWKGR